MIRQSISKYRIKNVENKLRHQFGRNNEMHYGCSGGNMGPIAPLANKWMQRRLQRVMHRQGACVERLQGLLGWGATFPTVLPIEVVVVIFLWHPLLFFSILARQSHLEGTGVTWSDWHPWPPPLEHFTRPPDRETRVTDQCKLSLEWDEPGQLQVSQLGQPLNFAWPSSRSIGN